VPSQDPEPQATLHLRQSRAGQTLSARWSILCAAAALTALVAAAAAQSAPLPRLKTPGLDQIGRAGTPIRDSVVKAPAVRALAPNGYWGGQYRTAAGENVTIYASNSYPVDAALGQRWANFLASLLHGPEISTVAVFISTADEISRVCGTEAYACYSAQGGVIYAPGEDPSPQLSAEAVIAHEYGHHVAANRSNAPWDAIDWGPKRWASAMQVCARTKSGQLAPGAEDPVRYEVNPGEGWAETYRVLNQQRLGLTETPWEIVSDSLYPTPAALTAAAEDVTSPWQADTSTARTGSVTRTARTRTYAFATPLDGTLKVTLRSSAGLRVALDVYASTTRAAHAAGRGTLTRSTTVCGTRTYRVRVSELSGRGSFELAVAEP
jgi:hypothetical protein